MLGLALIAGAFCTLQSDWSKFKLRFGKNYAKGEEDLRLAIFADNLRYASLLNKIDNTATYGVTQFSDLSAEEFAQRHLGLTTDAFVEDGTDCYVPDATMISTLEKSFDWTTKGALAGVQDQGQCGSCWAFATTAAVESAWFIAGHDLVKLSEQQLVDCDEVQGGCEGGNMYPAEGYVQRHGLAKWDDYPYVGEQQTCNETAVAKPAAKIVNHCLIRFNSSNTKETEDIMRYHLVHEGPVVVGINANKAQFYTSGVMSSANCNVNGVNHAVLAVGYDLDYDTPYWKIRNSWGPKWGEQGYFRMAYGEDTCGVATSASYVFAE